MKMKKSILSQLLLIIVVLILINVLSTRFFVRLDFTGDKIYTLSKATKDIFTFAQRACNSYGLFYPWFSA